MHTYVNMVQSLYKLCLHWSCHLRLSARLSLKECLLWHVSINQSWGAYARGRIASPTLRRHSWRSRLARLHAGSLPIPSNSRQEASTCHSQEFCGRPLGLLQVGFVPYGNNPTNRIGFRVSRHMPAVGADGLC